MDIQVRFESGDGIQANKTEVLYKGISVGKVTDLHVSKDIKGVVATIEIKKEAQEYLSKDTRFWLVKPRVSLAGVTGLETLVSGVYIERALEAQAHQDLPFEQLVEALQPERNASHNPLFQVLFNHQSEIRSVTPEVQLEDLRLEGLAWDGQTAQFDLTLDIQEDENGIWASFDYAADLFDASTVERLAGHWRNLLREPLHPFLRTRERPDKT